MKYLVVECCPGYAVLLDEQGLFVKAANFNYTVGQTVEDPVLMKAPREERKKKRRWLGGIAAAAACVMIVLGNGYYQEYVTSYSSIFLSINPEVRMELNRHGEVVELTGENEDGRVLIEGYDAEGKDKLIVSDELIDRAIEMGFLKEGDQVAFSINAPEESLFREYGKELRDEVNAHLRDKLAVMVLVMDYHQTGGAVPEVQSDEGEREGGKEETVKEEAAGDSDYGTGGSDYGDRDD